MRGIAQPAGVTVTSAISPDLVEPGAEGERLSAGEIPRKHYTDTMIPNAEDKTEKGTVGLVLYFARS